MNEELWQQAIRRLFADPNVSGQVPANLPPMPEFTGRTMGEKLSDSWDTRHSRQTMAVAPFYAAGRLLSGETPIIDPATGSLNPSSIPDALQAATTAMTGGLLLGRAAIEAGPGITLTSGWVQRPPRATAGYHGTTTPEEFSKFKTSDKDLGVHFSTNPNVANEYSVGDYATGFNDLITGANKIPAPRTVPVVADIKKAFRLPVDPGYWNDAGHSGDLIRSAMRSDEVKNFPKGMLSALERAGNDPGGWQKNLIPMMEEKGYDAIKYPHFDFNRMNSYMVFDPKNIAPRFSQEGQEIVARRGGIIRPEKQNWFDPELFTWPEGMLK